MRSREEYVKSLEEARPTVYSLGERVENILDHPIIKPAINSMAETYSIASESEYEGLMTATSHLTGAKINRYNHVCHSIDDLIKRVKAARVFQNNVCSCAYRCAGCATINALYSVAFDMDQELKTEYHRRFLEYLRFIQNDDLAVAGGITDVKGDRGLRPSEQADPDFYLRIVEERGDGVIVRGAKAHQSGAAIAHEVLVLPTITMREEDKDYAVSFAVSSDTDGIIHIYQHNLYDSRRLVADEIDLGNAKYGFGYGTSLMIFDDVFVPWDRVFMCKEYEFTRSLMERLGRIMRMVSGACRASQCDLLLGAGATIAEYNGVERAPHIRDKLAEISLLIETSYGCALGAAVEGTQTPSGAWYPDALLANAALLTSKNAFYEVAKLTTDIAGGLVVTMPSEKDFKNPEAGRWMGKYLRGKADVPTEHRIRMFRFIENMAASPLAAGLLHGAGAPQVQKVVVGSATDMEEKKKLAKRLAGIEE